MFIEQWAMEQYMAVALKDIKIIKKIWQKDHLNHSIYNLLRWNEVKNAKARAQDLLVINRNFSNF